MKGWPCAVCAQCGDMLASLLQSMSLLYDAKLGNAHVVCKKPLQGYVQVTWQLHGFTCALACLAEQREIEAL